MKKVEAISIAVLIRSYGRRVTRSYSRWRREKVKFSTEIANLKKMTTTIIMDFLKRTMMAIAVASLSIMHKSLNKRNAVKLISVINANTLQNRMVTLTTTTTQSRPSH